MSGLERGDLFGRFELPLERPGCRREAVMRAGGWRGAVPGSHLAVPGNFSARDHVLACIRVQWFSLHGTADIRSSRFSATGECQEGHKRNGPSRSTESHHFQFAPEPGWTVRRLGSSIQVVESCFRFWSLHGVPYSCLRQRTGTEGDHQVFRGNIEKQLRTVSKRLRARREDLRIADEQLAQLAHEADDARLRSLVSETPVADREHRDAARHAEKMRNHRAGLVERIGQLEAEQDSLLDQLGTGS